MSSSEGGSDQERSQGGNDGRGPRQDLAWTYATVIDGNKQKTQCVFCGKRILGGGITRFKEHLVGGFLKNTTICPKCPKEIREQIKKSLEKTKVKSKEKKQRENEFKEALFGPPPQQTVDVDSDDEDDYAYPSDCDTEQKRIAYRMALKESKRTEFERQQVEYLRRSGPRYGGLSSYEAGGGSGSGSGDRSTTKKQKSTLFRSGSMRTSAEDAMHKRSGPKQPTLKGLWGGMREKVGRAVSKFMFANAIAANTASGPFLQHMIDEVAAAGPGVKAPTPEEIMNKYLVIEKKELQEYIASLKKHWPEYGVTLMCDGWTSGTRRQIINFLVYCDGKSIFLRSVDASDKVRDHKYIHSLLKDVIKEVGKENIVQIVTDNGSNFKKAGKKIMDSDRYGIFWTPCAAHCIDLILKDFSKGRLMERVVKEARCVTNFIYNHSYLLALMRKTEFCGRDLVRPGVTRFATNYIALQSILHSKVGLKSLFSSSQWYEYQESRSNLGRKVENIINDMSFWDNVATVVRIMDPVVKVLRMVDGDKKPTMGSIYEAIRLMKEAVKVSARKSSKGYLKIIDERWSKMLLHPLHQAAYYLNPKYQYKQNLGTQSELVSALQVVVEKLETDELKQTEALNEVKIFRESRGSFGRASAVNSRDRTSPAEWWMLYGTDAPNLRKIAVKILSQTAAAGGCERNWSTFNLIHSKTRNRLGSQRLQDLVYVHYNLRLKMKHLQEGLGHDKEDYMDPIDLAYIFKSSDEEEDPLQAWMNESGQPVLDEDSRPNAQIAQGMGVDVDDYMSVEGRSAQSARGLDSGESADESSKFSDNDDSHGGNSDDGTQGGNQMGEGTSNTPHSPDRLPTSTPMTEHDPRYVEAVRTYRRRLNVHGEEVSPPPPGPNDDIDAYSHSDSRSRRSGYNVDDLTDSVSSINLLGDQIFGGNSSYDYSSFGYGSSYMHRGMPSDYETDSTWSSLPTWRPQSPQSSESHQWQDEGSHMPRRLEPSYSHESNEVAQQQQPLYQYEGIGLQPSPSYAYGYPTSGYGYPQGQPIPPPHIPVQVHGPPGSYPRIGFLVRVEDYMYQRYIMDYRTWYNHMTWQQYCMYLEESHRQQLHQESDDYPDPPRHSAWY